MTIKPFPNQILIKPFLKETILNQDEQIKCLYGRVEGVGDNVKDVKVGDILGYQKWGIKELDVKDEEFCFIHKDSDFLLCKIEGLEDV